MKSVLKCTSLGLFTVVVLYFRLFNLEAVVSFLYTTRSSNGAENTVPTLAGMYSAVASGWVGLITMWVITRRRVPATAHVDPFWVGQDRRDMRGQLVNYVMMAVIISTIIAVTLGHLFG